MESHKGKFGRFMLIGSLIGGAISLFDTHTRKNIYDNMIQIKDGTIDMYRTVRSNPRQVSNELRQTAMNIRMTAQEVANDMKEMVEKMEGMTHSSTQAYRYAVEAGDEISQMTQKIKTTGKKIPMIQQANTFKPSTQIQQPNKQY